MGGKFHAHFSVQKTSCHCYCSQVSQGRIPFVLCECPLVVITGSLPVPGCIFSCNTSLYLKFFAGREHLMNEIASVGIYTMLACGFCGVILTSFQWSVVAEESTGGCCIGEKNDFCYISLRSPLSLWMMIYSSGFL